MMIDVRVAKKISTQWSRYEEWMIESWAQYRERVSSNEI